MTSSLTAGKSSAFKRSKSFSAQSPSVSFAPSKRVCLAPSWSRRNSTTIAALYSSSSSEDDNDSEDESCYLNHQRKARKRVNSLRKQSISLVDDKLNFAISQYSDIDDEDAEEKTKKKDENVVCESISSPAPVSPGQKLKELDTLVRRDSQVGGFSSDSKSAGKKTGIDGDRIARDRCFDYLVSAIDEAWARYCDATSYAEDEVYNNVDYIPNTPASLGMSDNEEDDDDIDDEDDDIEAGYRSSATNLTEYDSEVESKRVSGQPSSVKLQQLKDRLLKAKYYLQDYLDIDHAEEAIAFWTRWDLVKYATIELVEDDDDDDVIESTIEELEKGRIYHCC